MKNYLVVAFAAAISLSLAGPTVASNKKANFVNKSCEQTTTNTMKCAELVASKKK